MSDVILAEAIVEAVLKELRGRSGMDLREIAHDEGIYDELVADLVNDVDDVLSTYARR